jgi:threonine synthase
MRMQYVSTRGGAKPATFEEAILNSFAPDGGLYVPAKIPQLSIEDLNELKPLCYVDIAKKLLRLYIPCDQIPDNDFNSLIEKSFTPFENDNIAPIVKLEKRDVFIQELFRGPTQSFKDIAMGFLVNCMDYFLSKNNQQLSLILATSGDTGPAAAFAAANKTSLHCWPLYPIDKISEQQARQMTTLKADNIHPVGVAGCVNGGDDLDIVVANLFADTQKKSALKLSSVNSINWCRVLVQTIHYFYGYFQVAEHIGDPVSFSVPTGAFGNLSAGFFARAMGLPIKHFICATNDNGTLHRVFEQGIFSKRTLKQTVSSAIDIVVPYNFWRFIYFVCGEDSNLLCELMDTFRSKGEIRFSDDLLTRLKKGYLSTSISDEDTLTTMREVYFETDNYLLDPHAAVAVAAVSSCNPKLEHDEKVICLATAHPAKFPDIVKRALPNDRPSMATHPSIEQAKTGFQHLALCTFEQLEHALTEDIFRHITSK